MIDPQAAVTHSRCDSGLLPSGEPGLTAFQRGTRLYLQHAVWLDVLQVNDVPDAVEVQGDQACELVGHTTVTSTKYV